MVYRTGFFVLALLTIAIVSNVQSAKIVGFFLTASKSHLFIHLSIADTLAQAGHDVTVFTCFPNVYKNAKYKHIQVGTKIGTEDIFEKLIESKKPLYQQLFDVLDVATETISRSLSDPLLQKFLNENGPGSVDLLLVGRFVNDFQLGLGGHFRCPIILTWMVQSNVEIDRYVGNPAETSYVPHALSTRKQPLSFYGRLVNFSIRMVDMVLSRFLRNRDLANYEKHFPASKYPALEEIEKNVSAAFINHHFSQGPIRPNVPALIEVGGIQIEDNPDPLPKDLADLFNQSKHGVIFFSLGSNVPSSILKEERVKTIFNTFAKLPYTFIWKWTNPTTPGSAPNVFFKSWLPQTSMLAHPKLKLFITHAGAGSAMESQHFGKPMVVTPLFGDQFTNAELSVNSGFAVPLDFDTFTEETLRNAIVEAIENPKYKINVEHFSKLYRDRPLTARQTALFWSEYVIRHKGAKHMQSPAVHMNFIQLSSLDVIAFLLVVLLLVLYIPFAIFRFFCCRAKKSNKKVKKN